MYYIIYVYVCFIETYSPMLANCMAIDVCMHICSYRLYLVLCICMKASGMFVFYLFIYKIHTSIELNAIGGYIIAIFWLAHYTIHLLCSYVDIDSIAAAVQLGNACISDSSYSPTSTLIHKYK